jgi:hypothetical protein
MPAAAIGQALLPVVKIMASAAIVNVGKLTPRG